MEEKNRQISVAVWQVIAMARTSTFWIGLFAACYLAVLPMADTIALRNVALLALLLCLGWHFRMSRPSLQCSLPLLLWVTYLLAFPLIANSSATAFESLLGQWGTGVLAMLAGAGVAAVFYNKDKGAAFYLGLVSAVPILVHLSLFAWKTWETSSIPWGYWGRETHHADLGYAAGQSVVLLAAAIIAGHRKTMRPMAIVLIIACLLSTALAHSRAGLGFSLIGGLLVVGASFLARVSYRQKHILISLIGIVVVGALVLTMAVRNDVRWRNMTSELAAGFYGDAIQLECEGTASIEPEVIANYGDQSQRLIASVQYGDGSRIVVLRAGIALALKHPWGSDGSRQAFQKLLRQECANPAISMAHTHNGWLDTILALGWAGALLYLGVLLFFMKQGLSYLHHESGLNEWVLVLVALSAFWILRGFTDSVFRDHMLEMQGFVLAFAFVVSRSQTKPR
jgi:hypothetical protein